MNLNPQLDPNRLLVFVISLVVLVGGGLYLFFDHGQSPPPVQTTLLAALAGVLSYWFAHATNPPGGTP